jgi:diguanylate cyclase (GGDEF)-like protein/PAS domain S-box-containing protein
MTDEHALSEAAVRDLYESAPCGLLSTAPDGVVTAVNETFLSWTGLRRDEVVGRVFTELLEPGSQLFYETRHLPILRLRGELREVAIDLRRADGSPLPALVNSVVVESLGGEPESIRLAVFDSTARRDYERDLLAARRAAEASADRVRILQAAASAFAETSSIDELAAALVDSAKDAMTATAATVVLLDERGNTFVAAGEHPLAAFAADGHAETGSFRHAGVSTMESVDVARLTHPLLADAMLAARVASFSIVPLIGPSQPIGALMLFFAREREFGEQDIDLQVAIARQGVQVLTRMQLQQELERLALHDQLTGLVNRKVIREQLSHAIGSAVWNEHSMALIFVDLDGFKPVNDELGHSVGDDILRWVAGRLTAVVRSNDVVGRFGGDEFVVICEDVDAESAAAIADRIVAALHEPSGIVPAEFAITGSVGVAIHNPLGAKLMTPETIFVAADAAMYRSKADGRDRVTVVEL